MATTSAHETQTQHDAAAVATQTVTAVTASKSSGTVTASTAVAFVQTDVEKVDKVETAAGAVQTEGEPPCCADAREQLQAQQETHSKSAAAASTAAEKEKARCLTELQGSYQEAIQKLVASVEKNLADARHGSGQRLQRALKRGTTLVAQRLNDRYMNAIQCIFEHVVDASGESAAQVLAEKAFASQGFKVNVTEVQHTTPEREKPRQQAYGKRDVSSYGSMSNTSESTPIHKHTRNQNLGHTNNRRHGFGRHLFDEVAAANSGRGGGTHTANNSMMNSSALLTPSPTPSPKSSPNERAPHSNRANINTPVAV